MYEVKAFDPKEWVLSEESFINSKTGIDIEKGTPFKWKIKSSTYMHTDPEKKYWNQKKITIYTEDEEEWMSFYRNYHANPPMAYVYQNGKEFLITSADYQCITIVNLTDKKIESYCLGEHDKGWGFCPTEFSVDQMEDGGCLDLRVEGCYWGAPYQYFYIDDIKDLSAFEFPDPNTIEMYDCIDE